MNQIKIPVSLSPHIVAGKPRGYYLLAQRLFPNGAPILRRDQFAGFNGCLIVTVARHNKWNTFFDMCIQVRKLHEQAISWFGSTKLYPMNKGFRMYIPGSILKPPSADSKKIETIGIFRKHEYFGGVGSLYYLELQEFTAEVLLGKKKLRSEI